MTKHSFEAFLAEGKKMQAFYRQLRAVSYEYHAREMIFRCDKIKLYRYGAKKLPQNKIPLLIVFATLNRPEILDLENDHSFIGDLLQQNMDVFLLDWGMPQPGDAELDFGDYIEALAAAVQAVLQKKRINKINLLGICQGGVICLCYAAIAKSIKNLILITTPVDFYARNFTLAKIVRKIRLEPCKQIPGAWLRHFFISLRPFDLPRKYLYLLDQLENEAALRRFSRIEKWSHDVPNQHGKAFLQFYSNFFQGNKLLEGPLMVNDQKIILQNIVAPVLNILASNDKLISADAARKIRHLVGTSDYTQKNISAGHIGLYVNDYSRSILVSHIVDWLKKRS